jgi:hypothetical protein
VNHPETKGQSLVMAAFWLGLMLAGQAATLGLIVAGPFVRYQHFVSPDRPLLSLPLAPLLIVGLEAVAVAVGVALSRRQIVAMVRGIGRPLGLVAVAMAMLTAAAPSRDPRAFAADLILAAGLQLVHLAAVVLFARALSSDALQSVRQFTNKILGAAAPDTGAEPGGVDRFAFIAAAWMLLVGLSLSIFVYQRHPHVPDEFGYLLHARYFAAGHLTMPLPAVPEAFRIDLMTYEATRWFSPVPPGWPMVLAVGALFGVPWLVNPVLAALDVLLVYVVMREFYSKRTARLTVLLFCLSPWQQFLAMSFMTHMWSLTCALVAAAAVGRLRRDVRARYALIGGAAIGVVSLIRPLEGVIVALLMGLWSLSARGRQWRFLPSALVTLSAVLVGALQLPYNAYLTGSARVFPLMAYFDRMYGVGSNDLGFGANRGFSWAQDPFPGHGLRDVVVNTILNTFAVNIELLGWATGSLILLGIFVFTARLKRSDWQMVLAIVVVTTAHHFYWFSGGPDFGARYWFLVILPCLALTSRGLEHLETLANREVVGAPHGRGSAVFAGAAALALGAMLLFVPWRATDKYSSYRGARPGIAALARDNEFGRSIVLVRTQRGLEYASAFVYGDLDDSGSAPLYAWDRNPEVRAEVLRAYADRPVWFVDAPSTTNDGYRVIAGPLNREAAVRVPGLWVRDDSERPGNHD